MIKAALEMNEYERPLFKNLKIIFDSFKRKQKLGDESKIRKLSAEEENTMELVNKFQSKISQLELNTARSTANYLKKPRLNKITRFNTKVSVNTSQNKKSKNSPHNNSLKSNTSFVSSNSPDKHHSSIYNIDKIIHVTEENK